MKLDVDLAAYEAGELEVDDTSPEPEDESAFDFGGELGDEEGVVLEDIPLADRRNDETPEAPEIADPAPVADAAVLADLPTWSL